MKKTKRNTVEFPYQNTSLEDLPGERWKDINGYMGDYQISSLGRTKSMSREVRNRWGTAHPVKERIKKPVLHLSENKLTKEPIYTLFIQLNQDGRVSLYSIGRLVYSHFVKDFDLSNTTIRIGYKDKDGRNLQYQNLYMTNMQELRLTSFRKGRSESNFYEMRTPVTQFDMNGKVLAYFESVNAASAATGIEKWAISLAAKGGTFSSGGYLWRPGRKSSALNVDRLLRSNVVDQTINEGTLHKSGKKSIDKSKPPAFVNLALRSMPGERWRSIPGYEELYQVSSYGRIKSLAGVVPNGEHQMLRKSRIVRIIATCGPSGDGSMKITNLGVALYKGSVGKRMSVSRLVYTVFKRSFDLSDRSLKIVHLDGDICNLHYKNLELKKRGS